MRAANGRVGRGWPVLRLHSWIGTVLAGFSVLNVVGAGAYLTLGPVIAACRIGPRGWGLVLAIEAAGLLCAHPACIRPAPRN